MNLGMRMRNLDVSPQFNTYSKVIIHIDDDTQVSAGDDGGRTLEVDNPLGTQTIANEMLKRLSGFQFQPYKAEGALLDPAAEIGDAVNTPSVYGGIYTRSRTFDRLMNADISAPCDEEINHEYEFQSPSERKFKRELGDVRASLIIQSNMIQAEVAARENADNALYSRITQTADAITAEVSRASAAEGNLSTRITTNANGLVAEVSRATAAEGTLKSSLDIQASQIAAKVSASGGGGSFSWVLNSNSHTWKSNNTEVMKISASGLWLKGQIEASSGKIGGFDIGANALSYNGLNWGDTSKNYGAYVGQSGIQLGKNFRVDNAGNVTANNVNASNMKLTGMLTIGDSTISANDLRLGAQRANSGYSSWNGTTSTVNNNGSYWSGGASNGNSAKATWDAAQDSYRGVSYMRIRTIVTDNTMTYMGSSVRKLSMTVNGVTYYYLGWAYPN